MDNINNDIIKLTSILESTQNDCNDSSSSSEDEHVIENLELEPTDTLLPESITTDEDTLFIIETCSDPLIKKALIYNIEKRKILNELIKNLEENLSRIKNIQREQFIRSLNGNKLDKKLVIKKRLGIPYFKDANFFPSPVNDDYTLMQKNKHFSVLDVIRKENWSNYHKLELVKAVYKYICASRTKEIENEVRSLEQLKIKDKDVFAQMIGLQQKLIIIDNKEYIESIAKKWQSIKIKADNCVYIKHKLVEQTDNTSLIILMINNWDTTNIDWESISEELQQKFTASECKSMWSCYLHPKFNKEPWKDFEDIKLQQIVEKYNTENWELIATQLNIQKSAYQCCVHFLTKLYDKYLRTKWTFEEDNLLKGLVEESRYGEYINWNKVAHHFTGRTKSQIYSHYYKALLPTLTKGPFTIEEDVLLLALLKLQNNDMKKVKIYFPARSLAQLRDRFKTMSRDDSQEWTLKDDCRIIEHVEEYGAGKWYLLDDMNRSTACIRHRYFTLKRWFEQNPKDSIQDVQRRVKSVYRRKITSRFNLLDTAVQELLKIVTKHPSDEKEILNLSYINKKVLNKIPYYKSLKKNKNNSSFYKNISKMIRQKKTDNEGTLYKYFVNFFQPCYKRISRGKITEDVEAKAKRVWNILELLGVQLNLPKTEDELNDSILSRSDRNVVLEIMKIQPNNKRKQQMQLQYLIPPTPETLIGLRGLMLHSTTLRSHSRGNYIGYKFYVNQKKRFEKKGINYIKKRETALMTSLNEDDKKQVIRDRDLFWKRLKIIFSWPCIMQNTKIEPNIVEISSEEVEESPPPVKKRGRPVKPNKAWKIDLMNKARLEKKLQTNETNLNLPSTSQAENPFEMVKLEGNNKFSIQFKSQDKQILKHELTSDSDFELDEDVQKLVMETKINDNKINTDTAVINQMSKAIKNILVKTSDTTIPPDTTNETNKRKAKIIVIPSKKVKINNQ